LAPRFGVRMLQGGAAAAIHALVPFLFVTAASRISDELITMCAAARGRMVRAFDVETVLPLDYPL